MFVFTLERVERENGHGGRSHERRPHGPRGKSQRSSPSPRRLPNRPSNTVAITAAGPARQIRPGLSSRHPLNKTASLCSAARRRQKWEVAPTSTPPLRPSCCVFNRATGLPPDRRPVRPPRRGINAGPSWRPPAEIIIDVARTTAARQRREPVFKPVNHPQQRTGEHQKTRAYSSAAAETDACRTSPRPMRIRGLNLFHYNRSPIGGPPDISRQPERMIVQVLIRMR
jgi:hypothetical protein